MTQQFEIRRRMDAEKVLGDYDGIAPVESLATYCQQVAARIRSEFPDAAVTVDWHYGPSEGRSVDLPDGLDYHDTLARIDQIENDVWARGEWWVESEE